MLLDAVMGNRLTDHREVPPGPAFRLNRLDTDGDLVPL